MLKLHDVVARSAGGHDIVELGGRAGIPSSDAQQARCSIGSIRKERSESTLRPLPVVPSVRRAERRRSHLPRRVQTWRRPRMSHPLLLRIFPTKY